MNRQFRTQQATKTQRTLCVTPSGQVRRYATTEGRPCRRNLPGRKTMRQAAIAESIG